MHHATELPSTPKNHYRFAMIGTTSSGKTCLLAQMALAKNYSQRFTSSFVTTGCRLTQEEEMRKDQSRDLRQRYNFQIGEERLKAAQKDLQAYRLPAPTTNDTVRPMVTFRLSDAEERGDFFIWTEDYAGELLAVDGLSDPTSHSYRLKENFLYYDGLIVVVDAVCNPNQEKQLRRQVENLHQFLGALAEAEKEKRTSPIPMVVVLPKWDRVSSPIDFQNPANEQKKLAEYLEKHSICKSIITAIQSKAKAIDEELEETPVHDLTAGIACGSNAAIFPTSAFGKAILSEKGEELPDPAGSGAFCLVEPYYWLANKCDELQTKQFEKRLNAIPALWPWGLWALRSEMKTCRKKIRALTPCKKSLNTLLQQSSTKLLKFIFAMVLFLAFLIDVSCLGMNLWKVNSWENTISNRESSVEEIRTAKEKLNSCKTISFRGLLLGTLFSPSNQRIEKAVKKADAQIDELLWTPVTASQEPAKKAEFALKYLEILPNGLHATEAQKVSSEYAVILENSIWENALKACRENSSKGLQMIDAYLERFGKNAIHYAEATQKKLDGLHLINWEKAKMEYEKECQGENIPNIICKLGNLISTYGTSPNFCDSLIRDLPTLIESKRSQVSRNIKMASLTCDQITLALRDLESCLRKRNESEMADLILTAIQDTELARSQHLDSYDQSLYQKIFVATTLNSRYQACETYINEMKAQNGGAMMTYVENYKTFLEKSREPRDVSLKMELYWGPQTPIYQVRGTIIIDGMTIYDEISKTWKNAEKIITSGKWLSNVDPSKNHTVEIRFVSENNWWGDEAIFGSCKENNVRLSELEQGKQFILDDKYGYGGKLRISVTNFKSTPEMPSWKKK